MKLDVLGLNHFDSGSATCQTVRPPSFAGSAGHFNIAPPQSSSARPKLSLYQAARRLWSDVDLKKTPPIPVTRAIIASFSQLLRIGAAGLNPPATAPRGASAEKPAPPGPSPWSRDLPPG